MVRIAPLLLVALVGCQRDTAPGLPDLFSDPSRVDLAVDSPLQDRPAVDVRIANVGDGWTSIAEVVLVGAHADLVGVDAPIGAELAAGDVVTVHLELVSAGDALEAPFFEELELNVIGAAPESGEPPSVITIVGVGTLSACDLDDDGHLSMACGGDDCDDEDPATAVNTWFPDQDGDGAAAFDGAVTACEAPAGYLDHAEDCDDRESAVHPGAVEVCDGVDQDCDAVADDGAVDAGVYYPDRDGDGHGGPRDAVTACARPEGYSIVSDDCDDQDASAFPGAPETCDRADDDCDGSIDEDAVDVLTAYLDQDRDQHGDPSVVVTTCTLRPGLSAQGDDCNDSVALVFPGALEICNSVDDDCDGIVDDGAKVGTFYADADRDGFGLASSAVTSCAAPNGYAATSGDCNDVDAKVFPGAVETCDGRDEDCDGLVDDGVVGGWYRDADGDKFGDPAAPSASCAAQPGYVRDSADCNDADKLVFPGAVETCDGRDQDCDGKIDDSPIDGKTFYADADGDKFGNGGVFRVACTRPTGFVTDTTDCNDADPGVFPGAIEICDGRDQDCDGVVDDGATGLGTWYRDLDKDTFGNDLDISTACSQPAGYVARGGDCDDRAPTINPNGKETCNGRDDDCDGQGDEGGVCPCPTFSFATSTYLICDLQVPAVAALAACKNFGYSTSDVDSAEEDAFLDAAVNLVNPGRSFWIGLNDLNVEGRHEWYSGLPVTFLDWSPGQPNDPTGQEDCVVIDASRHWSDANCFNNNSFVCEQN